LALQSIRYRLLDALCRHGASCSRGIRFAFRVCGPSPYRPYGLGAPALLSVPYLSCAVFRRRTSADRRSGNPFYPLFAFGVPPEHVTVAPSRPAATGPLLSWAFLPFSTCRSRRSTHCECAALTTVPPSGFGYPRDGLLPSIPGRFCFTPAALVGFSCRSHSSVGFPGRFRSDRPTYRFSCRCSRHYGRAGPASRGSWAFSPSEVPCSACGFSASAAGDSLGFPFQGFRQ